MINWIRREVWWFFYLASFRQAETANHIEILKRIQRKMNSNPNYVPGHIPKMKKIPRSVIRKQFEKRWKREHGG